ncbi:hypothetical protein, partial [Qipengyuania algicida]|uniref:hypothetical protein n=1 Tax=Qipengyuania algicida TaxID=1836209 RepID=UPI001F30FF94
LTFAIFRTHIAAAGNIRAQSHALFLSAIAGAPFPDRRSLFCIFTYRLSAQSGFDQTHRCD